MLPLVELPEPLMVVSVLMPPSLPEASIEPEPLVEDSVPVPPSEPEPEVLPPAPS